MCSAGWAAFALSAASTGYTLYEQRQNAKAQARINTAAYEQQKDQAHEEKSAAADRKARQAREERARLRALTAESGLTGISMDSVLDNVDMQAAQDIGLQSEDYRNTLDQARTRYWSNSNQVNQPDYVGAAANTGLSLTRTLDDEGYFDDDDG